MHRPSLLMTVSLSVALSGCQLGHRSSSYSQPAILKVEFDTSQVCQVVVDGQNFALPADEPALKAALTLQAARYRAAKVVGRGHIPYKCFGYAIFIAQGSGFKRVDFFAGPPLPAITP
jgi:hypothetical protein